MTHRKKIAATLLAGAAVAATIAGAGAPAQASEVFRMNIWKSSHCLDNATEKDSKLQMWNCGSGSEQRWIEEFNSGTGASTFANQRTGLCISAPEFGAGTVIMDRCNSFLANQQWRVFATGGDSTGSYIVWQNVSSGLCLTTPSVGNGTLVQTTECDTSDPYDLWQEQL